jgi:hypothetical protein
VHGGFNLDFSHLYTPKSSASGGGGGGSIIFEEGANSPIKTIENGVGVYAYEATLGQTLFTALRVPSSYVSGTQIFLKVLIYSSDNTGNVLLQSVSTLIRPAVDAITSTTNQRTSTNAAIALSAGTVNEPQIVNLDLTSSSGQINSVSVSSGDLILVSMTRGTDTSTVDLDFILQSAEGVFS